jgi:hypothetical protein
MKLQKTSQGVKVTSDFLLKPYLVLGYSGFLGLIVVKPTIDLIILFLKVQLDRDAYWWIGLVLLLLSPSMTKTLIMLWQELSKFQLAFCEIDPARQQIVCKLSNFLFQRKVLNLPIAQIQDIQVLYCGQSSSVGEEKYGLRINLEQGQCLYLDRGTLLLQQAQEFAQMLQSSLRKPVVLDPQIDRNWFDRSFWVTTLERTTDKFCFRTNYAIMNLLVCLFLMIIGPSIPSAIAAFSFDAGNLNQLFRWGTPIAMLWVMQTLGFQETWCFDRSTKQFYFERQLLIGRKSYRSENTTIRQVKVIRSYVSKRRWLVTLDAPNLERIVGREIVGYDNQDLKLARAFAEDLRHYLNQA